MVLDGGAGGDGHLFPRRSRPLLESRSGQRHTPARASGALYRIRRRRLSRGVWRLWHGRVLLPGTLARGAMTQLRCNPASISNYFDDLIRGIGKRVSTFTDIDAVTHDLDTKRFLFQEFKHEGEALCTAQRWVLNDLAHMPRCTVWIARVLDTRPLTCIEVDIV